MAERWTRQRRLEHTRAVLLDAAEQVFAKQGFGGAALEDIAEIAGYTRGAIYSHFGAKEELFLAVIERHLQQLRDSFEDVIGSFAELADLDIDLLAQRWRELTIADPVKAALGFEFSLFLLRNPDARDRLAAKREQIVQTLTDYISTHTERLGGTLRIPAETLARLLTASHEAITISGHLDGRDLARPYVELILTAVAPKTAPPP